jgi:ABC-2 type transport system permease protein
VQEGENVLMEFAFRLPGSLYSGVWRLVFRVFLPYGLIATFPSEVFFSETNIATWAAVLGVVASFSAARRLVWARGLARYSGAS